MHVGVTFPFSVSSTKHPLKFFHLYHSFTQSNSVPSPKPKETGLLPAVKEEEFPTSVLFSVNEVALESVCGGVGDRAEPVRQPVVVQLPWRKGVTSQTLVPSTLPTCASEHEVASKSPRGQRAPSLLF